MNERNRSEDEANQLINSSDESIEALMADNEIDLGDEDLGDLEDGIEELNFDPSESLDSDSSMDDQDLE